MKYFFSFCFFDRDYYRCSRVEEGCKARFHVIYGNGEKTQRMKGTHECDNFEKVTVENFKKQCRKVAEEKPELSVKKIHEIAKEG